jgi:kynurenine formamidase
LRSCWSFFSSFCFIIDSGIMIISSIMWKIRESDKRQISRWHIEYFYICGKCIDYPKKKELGVMATIVAHDVLPWAQANHSVVEKRFSFVSIATRWPRLANEEVLMT